jgi:hypothetical protein
MRVPANSECNNGAGPVVKLQPRWPNFGPSAQYTPSQSHEVIKAEPSGTMLYNCYQVGQFI